MIFNKFIGIGNEKIDPSKARYGVKAIVLKEGKVLLLRSNRGDYTLPGGGIEEGESHQEAIKREIREETGYTCTGLSNKLGRLEMRRIDLFDEHQMYETINYYYKAWTSDVREEVMLTYREKKLELTPVWLGIDEAIDKNEKYLEACPREDTWLLQEMYVLGLIRSNKEGVFDQVEKVWCGL